MNVEEIIRTSKKIPLYKRTIIHLFLVNNKVNDEISCTLKPYGLSIQQYNVLSILRGQKGKPANLSTINERMVAKMSNTTRLVDKLISKGYVERCICEHNRRKVEINITKGGLNILSEIDLVLMKTEEKVLHDFTEEELLKFNLLLDKF